MSQSPIITVEGFNLPADIGSATAAYMPDVTALTGVSSLEQVTTVGLGLKTLVLFPVNNVLTSWLLVAGAASVSDSANQVAPLDYDAGTNDVHWVRSAGFGSNQLAGSRVTSSSAINLATGIATALTFDSARFNNGGWSSSNPTMFKCASPGIYQIDGQAQFAANSIGQRTLAIRLNGSTIIGSQTVTASTNSSVAALPITVSVSCKWNLVVGDYVELVATQNSGGTLQVLKADAYSPEFSALYIGGDNVLGIDDNGATSSALATGTSVNNGTDSIVIPFNISDVGWYRFFSGVLPAGGQFRLQRLGQGAGNYADFLIDFGIIGDISNVNEGAITLLRNCIPVAGLPPVDIIRIAHVGTACYVDVRLQQSGSWQFEHRIIDTGFVDAPFLVPTGSVNQFDQSLEYRVVPNVIGSTAELDAAKLRMASRPVVQPPGYSNTWVPWTGTSDRTTKDTASATTLDCAKALKSLIDDLVYLGVLQLFPPAGGGAGGVYASLFGFNPYDLQAGATEKITNITKITAAPNSAVVGTYVSIDTLNSKTRYFMLGYQYRKGSNVAAISWNGSIWEVYDNTGARQYHQLTGTTNPWDAATWKDEANNTQTVTFVAPNINLVFGNLTTTPHTAEQLAGSTLGYNGLYTLNGTLNGKNRYYLVGTGTNNKRIEWSGTQWLIKDDSATAYTSNEDVTYPDQVVAGWTPSSGVDVVSLDGISQLDLSAGISIFDPAGTCSGNYLPQIGSNNVAGGRQLIYGEVSGGRVIVCDGTVWKIYNTIALGSLLATSDTFAKFPWEASWATALLTTTSNKALAPDAWV